MKRTVPESWSDIGSVQLSSTWYLRLTGKLTMLSILSLTSHFWHGWLSSKHQLFDLLAFTCPNYAFGTSPVFGPTDDGSFSFFHGRWLSADAVYASLLLTIDLKSAVLGLVHTAYLVDNWMSNAFLSNALGQLRTNKHHQKATRI